MSSNYIDNGRFTKDKAQLNNACFQGHELYKSPFGGHFDPFMMKRAHLNYSPTMLSRSLGDYPEKNLRLGGQSQMDSPEPDYLADMDFTRGTPFMYTSTDITLNPEMTGLSEDNHVTSRRDLSRDARNNLHQNPVCHNKCKMYLDYNVVHVFSEQGNKICAA